MILIYVTRKVLFAIRKKKDPGKLGKKLLIWIDTIMIIDHSFITDVDPLAKLTTILLKALLLYLKVLLHDSRVRLSACGATIKGVWSRAGRYREGCGCRRPTTRTRRRKTEWRERWPRNRVNGKKSFIHRHIVPFLYIFWYSIKSVVSEIPKLGLPTFYVIYVKSGKLSSMLNVLAPN